MAQAAHGVVQTVLWRPLEEVQVPSVAPCLCGVRGASNDGMQYLQSGVERRQSCAESEGNDVDDVMDGSRVLESESGENSKTASV